LPTDQIRTEPETAASTRAGYRAVSDVRRNKLLAALPPAALAELGDALELMELRYRQILTQPGEVTEFVFFPLNGVGSVLALTDGGPGVEVASVGSEGMVNLHVFLGADRTHSRCVVQVPGRAVRLRADALRHAVTRSEEFSDVLFRYTNAYVGQLAQSVACNRLHPLEERCARWLLTMQDRAGDQFPITHEFLSQMLGVRRATVTVAAGILQKAGLIRYTRGRMEILDRARLEKASCECYRIVRDMYEAPLTGR
jgi:CRP-like cAMP-binding protein